MKNNETGRSMVEMLGVLAIIGVLSAGGLAGYSKAMFKHKLNSTMEQISTIVTNIRTMYGTQGNYTGLSGTSAINLGIIPAVMGSASDKLVNPFKGSVKITTYDFKRVSNSGFKLTYEGLPKEACIALATADFGSGAGSGFIGVNLAGSGVSTASPTTNEGKAYSMSDAISSCTDNGTITWFFY